MRLGHVCACSWTTKHTACGEIARTTEEQDNHQGVCCGPSDAVTQHPCQPSLP